MCKIDEMLTHKLVLLIQDMNKSLAEELQKIDLTIGNYMILLLIYEHPGITQRELASVGQKDRTVIGQNIDKLEAMSYVERVKIKSDRRCYTLYVTEKGCGVLSAHWSTIKKSEKHLLQELNMQEREYFIDILDRLRKKERGMEEHESDTDSSKK